MQSHHNVVQRSNGSVISGASVYVYLAGTATEASIYSADGSGLITQPLLTNTEGEFEFWAANGRYDVSITYESVTDSYEIILFDSAEDPILLDNGSDVEVGDPGTEVGGVDVNGTTYDAKLRINDIGGTKPAQAVLHRHSTTLPSVLLGTRSNSDDSTHAAVTASQGLFSLIAGGWTGTHYDLFGSIEFTVNSTGTISATSSPGMITLNVTPDGSNVPVNAIRVDADSTAGNTRLYVYDVDNGQLERVSVGAADSGGVGYKLLRIPN
jgi:hypothetical protein